MIRMFRFHGRLFLPTVWVNLFCVMLISTFYINPVNAQVATYYNFTQSSGTFTPGISTTSTTPADVFTTSWDDLTTVYALPFDFTYNGTLFTAATGKIGVDTDGWLTFSNGTPTMTGTTSGGSWVSISDQTGVFLNGTANNNSFAGLNCDLNAQSFSTITGTLTTGSPTITGVSSVTNIMIGTRLSGTGITNGTVVIAFTATTITMSANATSSGSQTITPWSSIYAFTRGTAPNRQFVVQWTQAKRYSSSGENISFQLILNEGNANPTLQTLQVLYGSCTATSSTALETQVGLRGASAADFNARKSSTGWATTVAATANTDLVRFSNTLNPASGLTFTWSPCTAAPGAAGAISGPVTVCPNTLQNYSIAAVAGATSYTWTYSGTGTTFTASTTTPSNTFNFSTAATGGTITVTPANLCGNGTSSSQVVAVTAVTAATIYYPAAAYCASGVATVPVTLTGPGGGTYTTSPVTGLTIVAGTGTITPGSSTAGNYTVIYTYTSNGCSVTATTSVTITALPVVTALASPSVICIGSNSQLTASVAGAGTGYSMNSIPYNSLSPSGSPTVLWNSYIDDGQSAATIPFTFTYFGSAVTTVNVTTNGYVELTSASGTATAAQTLPNAASPNNVIALAWRDLVVDPTTNTGSNVRWFVNGTTPNRVMVIDYTNLRFLAGSGAQNVTGQIRLYESDNHIEVAAGTVNDNGSNYAKTLGIENSTGTVGLSPAGRNNVAWNLTNEAWSFYPVAPAVYTYSWSPSTFLSSTGIYNPVATAVTSTTNYTVTVTNTTGGCTGTAGVTVNAFAPLNGTYTVGAAGNFPTLTAAVNAYNTVCIGGPVIFSLIDASYSISEAFPISINSNAYQSATNTLTIRPASGVSASITGALASNALIRITGKYIKIDGSNNNSSSRNLTITNTSTTSPRVVLLGSVSNAAPVSNVLLKNCILVNGINSTASAVLISDATTLGNAGYFTNDTIQNNSLQNAYFGIYSIATVTAGNGSGLLINSNDLSTSGTNAIKFTGIYVQGADGINITGNNIGNFENTSSEMDAGIWLATGTVNSTIERNTIHDLKYAGSSGYGGRGISISSGSATANIAVINNMIYGISGDGDNYNSFGPTYSPAGIYAFGSGQAGVNIYHNTIYLSGNTLAGTDKASIGIALGDNTKSSVKNNLIVNNLGRASGTVIGSIGIAAFTSNAQFTALNNNDYDINPTGTGAKIIGRIASANQTTLGGWQTATVQEANGLNISPVFVSATDLHIKVTDPGNQLNLSDKGTPVAITIDYDSTTRNGLTPDIGADEWLKPNTGSWVGKTSIDWLVGTNWETNYKPGGGDSVFITGGYTFMPTIVTTEIVKDIDFSKNNPVLTINGGVLQVNRNITRTGNIGTIIASNGTLEMMGTAPQTVPASLFQGNNLKNLIVSNTDAATGVTLGGTLDIYRSVTFGSGASTKLTTGGFLTFKSTATETAWLGQLSGSNSIAGTAGVERYIPLHSKAWQFLSTPITATSTQTVNQAWQEGSIAVNDNLVPGFGTQLTSNRVNATTRPSPGFDAYTPAGPSIKVYNHSTGGYTGLNRTDTLISNPKGYMVFVRGNRAATTLASPVSATVMRTKGTLHTPANPPVTINITTPGFESIGNPYASAINYHSLTFGGAGGIQSDIFYLWDPKLTTGPTSAWGLGGIQTFTWNGSTFTVTPGGGSYTGANRNIESGQAFFVNVPFTSGTLSFTEACKVSGSNNVNRVPVAAMVKQLRTNLNVITSGASVLLDGNRVQFDRSWSNAVDIKDAVKLNNSGENLGITRVGKTLAVERHAPVQPADTIFYSLGQLKVQQYEFEFIPENMQQPVLEAYLVDKYLHSNMPVSLTDTTRLLFNIINDAGSYASDRFYLVFRKPKKQHELPANSTITKNSITGKQAGSLAKSIQAETGISVYPNPVKDRIIQVQFTNQPAGTYQLQLANKLGQQVYSGSIQLNSSLEHKQVQLDPAISKGAYQLTITGSTGTKTVRQVIIN